MEGPCSEVYRGFCSPFCWIGFILGSVFDVFAGLMTAAFSVMLSLNSPVYQVVLYFGCFVLLCICDLSSASGAALVALLVGASPTERMVVGLSSTRGSSFFLWVSCVVLLHLSVVLSFCCLASSL